MAKDKSERDENAEEAARRRAAVERHAADHAAESRRDPEPGHDDPELHAKAAKAQMREAGTGTRKVSVCCKIPNGLLLRVFEFRTRPMPVLGGGTRDERESIQVGDTVRVNGPMVPWGRVPLYPIVGGYAVTAIDADFWALWVEQNADHDAVRKKLVFAQADPDAAMNLAQDRASLKSGLEPLTPDKDPRAPRPGNQNLTAVEKSDTKAA